MDGASKFVRGDSIAGILILFINIIGGLIVGLVQHHLEFQDALQNTFCSPSVTDWSPDPFSVTGHSLRDYRHPGEYHPGYGLPSLQPNVRLPKALGFRRHTFHHGFYTGYAPRGVFRLGVAVCGAGLFHSLSQPTGRSGRGGRPQGMPRSAPRPWAAVGR